MAKSHKAEAQGIVRGYFPYYRSVADVNNVQYSKVTDIVYAFVDVGATGTLSIRGPGGSGDLSLWTPLRTNCNTNGVKLYAAIGGAGLSGNFSGVASNATYRDNLATACLNLCTTYNLAGIDVDWEFPSASDQANVTLLYQAIKAKLGSTYKLTAALGGESFTSSCTSVPNAHTGGYSSAVWAYIDQVNIMTYDGPSCFTSHTGVDFMQKSMTGWNALGVPYNKMVPGCAFYTRGGANMWKDFANSTDFNDANGVTSRGGIDTKATLLAKANYAMCSNGALGLMVWELSQDIAGTYNLTTAMYDAVQTCGCPFGNPNLGPDKSICGVSSVNVDCGIATASNRTFSWKKDGATFTGNGPTNTFTAAGTYDVTISQGTCTKTDQIVISNTLPAPDFTSAASNLCTPLPYTLTPSNLASYPAGTTWQWQKDGVTISGATSSSLTGIRAAGAYKLTATAGTCTSNSTKTLTSGMPTPVDGSGPAGSAIPLSITNTGAGPYYWFANQTGGSSLATGTSYSPVVSATTTYYVQTGAGVAGSVGGTGAFGAIDWSGTITNKKMDFTTAVAGVNISSVDVYVGEWASVSGLVVSIETSGGTLIGSTSAISYDNSGSGTAYKLTINTSSIPALSSAGNYRIYFSAGTGNPRMVSTGYPITEATNSISLTGGTRYFTNIQFVAGSACARLPVIANVTAGVAAPGVVSPVTYCQNATATVLTATPSSGGTLKWYGTNATGGTASSTAPSPSTTSAGTTSYYVSQVVGGTESARVKIDVVVNANPAITSTTPASRCGTGTVTLAAMGSAGTINWYAGAAGGTSLGTGANFTTPSISATTPYYVAATSGTCTTPTRTLINATVNAIPTISGTTPASRCGAGTVVLSATASAGTINWYTGATGGTSLGTGTSFTTPSISATTPYYVEATSGTCTSPTRTLINATVNAIPTITGTTPSSRCGNGTVALSATASAGTINWYSGLTGGTSLGTGTSFTTPSISSSTTYYVDATNGTCTSTSRTSVLASVTTLVSPTVSITATQSTICPGTSVTFTATPVNGGSAPVYQWKKNGTVVGTNASTFTTTALANNDVISVVMTSNATCVTSTQATSNSITIVVTSTVTPSVTISAPQTTICTGGSVTFTATPVNGGTAPVYQWKRNGSPVGTNASTFTTSTIATGDVFSVTMTSNAACLSTATANSTGITMTVNAIPAKPASFVTSSATVTQGQSSVAYSIAAVSGATNYTWTYSGTGASISNNGSNSILINFNNTATSGILSVNASNTCGNSTSLTMNITVNSVITPPPGPFTVFSNPVDQGTTSVMYCVANTLGTTYQWSYSGSGVTVPPTTSNCISLDFASNATSGQLSVVANNGSGSSTPSTLAITVQTATGTIAPIEGLVLESHPNPFQDYSTIKFDLQAGAQVNLEVYNTYGMKVKTIVSSKMLSVGKHEYLITDLPVGAYIVRLRIGEKEQNIKLIKQ